MAPVHLGRTGDHVFDVVGVPRAIHVGVVAIGRFVFHMGGIDGNASGLFLRSRVDIFVFFHLSAGLIGQANGDRRRQSGFAMIHMTYGSDVSHGVLIDQIFLWPSLSLLQPMDV